MLRTMEFARRYLFESKSIMSLSVASLPRVINNNVIFEGILLFPHGKGVHGNPEKKILKVIDK